MGSSNEESERSSPLQGSDEKINKIGQDRFVKLIARFIR